LPKISRMFRTTRFSILTAEGANRVGTVFHTLRSQPGWITRLALLTVFIIIGLPIVLLVMIALLAGIFVFGLLAAINILIWRIRARLTGDGRQNVRVIQRIET